MSTATASSGPVSRRALRRSCRPSLGGWVAAAALAWTACGPSSDPAPHPGVDAGPALASLEPGARFWHRTCSIELAAPHAEPALIDGWSRPEPNGGSRWAIGESSELWLDALGGEDWILELEGWAYEGAMENGRQTVQMSIDGRSIGALELTASPGRHRLDVPADLLSPGRHRLRFSYASAAPAPGGDSRRLAAGWRSIDARRTRGGDESLCDRVDAPLGRFENGDLRLPLESAAEVFFEADELRRLVIGAVRLERGSTEDSTTRPSEASLVIVAERSSETGSPTRIESSFGPGARDVVVEVPAGVGPVRLAFAARGGMDAAMARDELVVAGARLAGESRDRRTRPGPLPSPAEPVPRQDSDASPARPNVLIYLVDTLRADHLGCYGYDRPTSPRIDAFAREAVLFERAVAQSSWTRPTAAALLTGLDPRVHGVHGRDDRLPDSIVTLPERLGELGYETMAVVTNGNVSPAFGFRQGFDEFTFLRESARRGRQRRSRRVTEIATGWLKERLARDEQRPFFLYLHTTDPHAPYAPAPARRKRFLDRPPGPRVGSLGHLRDLAAGSVEASPETVEEMVALYDAEIAANDHWFGVLLDGLEELDLARDTLVVFVADHGEEFGEHGGWQHGVTLYQEQLHVPLLMRLPGGALAGERRADRVQQTDVVPTVLEILGAPVPAGLQGRPLVARSVDGSLRSSVRDTAAFAVLELDGRSAEAVLSGDRKLVVRRADVRPRPRRLELFDLSVDPLELVDRSADEPIRFGLLDALLRSLRRLWPEGAAAERAVIDPELEDDLRALGYIR